MTPQDTMRLALKALELAHRSHGTMLLSDPPQEAWKANRVDCVLFNAIEALREALAQQEEQQPVGYWGGEFSNDGGATLYKVPQESLFGRKYVNIPLYAGAAPAAQPVIRAVFRYEDAELIGTTDAPINRVDEEDDGSLTVVIDHWPQQRSHPNTRKVIEQMVTACREIEWSNNSNWQSLRAAVAIQAGQKLLEELDESKPTS